MKRRISGLLLTSILSLASLQGVAQQEKDLFKKTTRGFRFGVDFSKPVVNEIFGNKKGFELLADYQFAPRAYASVEGGYESISLRKPNYSYEMDGSFYRLGVDYDILNSLTTDDIVFFGLRYGYSRYSHQASDIIVETFYGDYYEDFSKAYFNAHWASAVFGMKAELFFLKNVYMGWTVYANFRLGGIQDDRMDAFLIPGYGKGSEKVSVSYNWHLSYRIPLKKEIIEKEK